MDTCKKKRERERLLLCGGDVRNCLGWEVIFKVRLKGEWEFSG